MMPWLEPAGVSPVRDLSDVLSADTHPTGQAARKCLIRLALPPVHELACDLQSSLTKPHHRPDPTRHDCRPNGPGHSPQRAFALASTDVCSVRGFGVAGVVDLARAAAAASAVGPAVGQPGSVGSAAGVFLQAHGVKPIDFSWNFVRRTQATAPKESIFESKIMRLGRTPKAYMTDNNLNYHTQVIGGSGAGKTNLLKVMIEDRVRRGHGSPTCCG